LADFLAAGNFAEASVARVIGDQDDIAGKKRSVGAAEVEQHAVMAGDGHHTDGLDQGRGHRK